MRKERKDGGAKVEPRGGVVLDYNGIRSIFFGRIMMCEFDPFSAGFQMSSLPKLL